MIQLYNEQAEKVILGSILITPALLLQVKRIINADCFSSTNKKVYEAILQAEQEGNSPDLVNVSMILYNIGFDITYTSELTQFNSRHVEGPVKVVYEYYMRRQAMQSLQAGMQSLMDGTDIFQALDTIRTGLTLEPKIDNSRTLEDVQALRLKELTEADGWYKEVPYIPSGFETLDRGTRGFEAGHVWVVAGLSGTGKTTFTIQIGRQANKLGFSGAFFSLEMKATEIGSKLIAQDALIEYDRVRIGKITASERQKIQQAILSKDEAEQQMYIDDTAGASLHYIETQIQALKKKHDIKYCIIDYLQLITHSGPGVKDERTKIVSITRKLKQIAKDNDVAIFELSQLSRAAFSNLGGRPSLKDLKESSSIVEDADGVILLYRPEKHGIDTMPDGTSAAGKMEIMVAKNRHGDPFSFWCDWNRSGGTFIDAGYSGDRPVSFEQYNRKLLQDQKYDKSNLDDYMEGLEMPVIEAAMPKIPDVIPDNPFDDDLPF